jgi:hypothetical protein
MIMEPRPEAAPSNSALAFIAFVAMWLIVSLMLAYARFN